MDKQFARILMLSVLLPAGATLAEAIEHDHAPLADPPQSFVVQLAQDTPTDPARKQSLEGRRLLKAVADEEDAAVGRRGR
jgi:hypothetical protein